MKVGEQLSVQAPVDHFLKASFLFCSGECNSELTGRIIDSEELVSYSITDETGGFLC